MLLYSQCILMLMRKSSHRNEKKFSPQWEKILMPMRIFSHRSEKIFSSRWEYFGNWIYQKVMLMIRGWSYLKKAEWHLVIVSILRFILHYSSWKREMDSGRRFLLFFLIRLLVRISSLSLLYGSNTFPSLLYSAYLMVSLL